VYSIPMATIDTGDSLRVEMADKKRWKRAGTDGGERAGELPEYSARIDHQIPNPYRLDAQISTFVGVAGFHEPEEMLLTCAGPFRMGGARIGSAGQFPRILRRTTVTGNDIVSKLWVACRSCRMHWFCGSPGRRLVRCPL
jgi:hypothetical protein